MENDFTGFCSTVIKEKNMYVVEKVAELKNICF